MEALWKPKATALEFDEAILSCEKKNEKKNSPRDPKRGPWRMHLSRWKSSLSLGKFQPLLRKSYRQRPFSSKAIRSPAYGLDSGDTNTVAREAELRGHTIPVDQVSGFITSPLQPVF